MSNSVIAAIVTPIVVAIALAFWIVLVYRADRNPGGGRPEASDRAVPRRDVAGGTFRGGGRQVMPGATPSRRRQPATQRRKA